MKIQVKHVGKKIGNDWVLKDVDMTLESGKIYGLQGRNGSGKTMLLRTLCGLILPTEGQVIIDGLELGKDISFPESVGVLIENPGFINEYSGYKNLKFLTEIKKIVGEKEIRQIIEEIGLKEADKVYRKYSLGMKQKLGIAAAFVELPELVLLDEPMNALDSTSVDLLRKLINKHKERGAIIVLSSHDKEELQMLSDKIFYMENGKVVKSCLSDTEG